MILATHAIVGAAAAELTQNPAVAFTLAFASHFVLDAIPHWDYHLRSVTVDGENGLKDIAFGRDSIFDFLKIAADAILGTALAFYMYGFLLTPGDYGVVAWGIAGGVLPDFLQFMYCKIHREPLIALQKFHQWVHSKHRWTGRYIVGPLFQALFVLVVFWVVSAVELYFF